MSTITFTPNQNENVFWKTLQSRVDSYFGENKISPYSNNAMIVKIIVLLLFLIVPYLMIIFADFTNFQKWLLCIVIGFSMAGTGLAISHQAAHHAISQKSSTNRLLSLTFNLLGMSDYIWKIKHNVYHHAYTNIFEKDEALREGDVLRMSKDAPYKPMHRWQHIYAVFVYGLFTIFWAFILDFEKFFRYNRDGQTDTKKKRHTFFETSLFFATKIYYVAIAFIIPYFVGNIVILPIFIGFITMHIIASLIVTHVLQVEHLVAETTHMTPSINGEIEHSWAIVQLEGTSNFKSRSFILEWYLGGSNYQIEHHLFPRICAIHYPALSKIIKTTAKEFGFKYHCYDSFSKALQAHYLFLQHLGQKKSLK